MMLDGFTNLYFALTKRIAGPEDYAGINRHYLLNALDQNHPR
jgi:hypothetical protein